MIERILEESKKRGINNQELCKIAEAHKSKVYDWKKGRSEPTAREILLIANRFGISTDYLLTGKPPSPHLFDLELEKTDLEKILLENFRNLDETQKRDIVNRTAQMLLKETT